MDNDTIRNTLGARAGEALAGAEFARQDSQRPDLPAIDRAEHARRARELAAYARELLAIVRESGASGATRSVPDLLSRETDSSAEVDRASRGQTRSARRKVDK